MSTEKANRIDTGATSGAIQKAAMAFGIIFLIVGIAGFIPGLTTRIGDLSFAGHGSGAMLLGLFQVSVLHNIVHLLYGIVGLIAARTRRGARNYLVWGGVIYLVLWLYGLIFQGNTGGNFVPINAADNYLHLFLGVVMILLGLLVGRSDRSQAAR